MIKKLAVFISAITAILSFNNLLWAYGGEVHFKIGEAAVEASQLDFVLRDHLGIEDGTDSNFKSGKLIKPVWQWIAFGGEAEDYGKFGDGGLLDKPSTRAFNHFHDPLKVWDDAGLDDPINIFYIRNYLRIVP